MRRRKERFAAACRGWDTCSPCLAETIPFLKVLLGRVGLRVEFPTVATRLRWMTPAGMGRTTDLFGHAGALPAYSALIR